MDTSDQNIQHRAWIEGPGESVSSHDEHEPKHDGGERLMALALIVAQWKTIIRSPHVGVGHQCIEDVNKLSEVIVPSHQQATDPRR